MELINNNTDNIPEPVAWDNTQHAQINTSLTQKVNAELLSPREHNRLFDDQQYIDNISNLNIIDDGNNTGIMNIENNISTNESTTAVIPISQENVIEITMDQRSDSAHFESPETNIDIRCFYYGTDYFEENQTDDIFPHYYQPTDQQFNLFG
ncbi:1941_t:CDS:1 [Entrophospora sp. SA101]|nr:2883_t:CDS:1 [Entrophospora sp. SA101]CAJ0649250.1 9436_t:CDS:1 [Entrophospora sp. SA101]CAJ0756809.1 17238_t:CDS:1 [Entrophospora sp. SA101]CAJ0760808.1 1941_t:CDS:1 [Entrophospora sp. SA101]CAJ0831915.1 8310_t:CDS:1 [Entrophospora sp. SA101]